MKNWIGCNPLVGAKCDVALAVVLLVLLLPVFSFAQTHGEAQEKFNEGDYAAALEIYKVLLEDTPRNLGHQLGCAECYVELGDVTGAIAQYNTALFYFADSNKAKLGLAHALALDGRFDESLAIYEEVYLDEDFYIEAMVGRAHTYFLAGDLESAFKWIGEALHYRPEHAGALEMSQRLLASGGGPGPGQDATKEQLAEFAFNTGNLVEARELYEELAKADHPEMTTWYRVGKLREWDQEWENALSAYEMLLQHEPENYDALLRRAKLLWYSGNIHRALDAFEHLYGMPDLPHEYFEKGVASYAGVLRSVGAEEDAIVMYREALKVDPQDHDIRSAYATTLANLHFFDEAISQARMVIDENPVSSAGWLALANVYSIMGKRLDALDMYCMVDPESEYYAAAQMGKASTQLALWRRDDAIETLERLLSHDPDNLEALEMLYDLTRTPDAVLSGDWRHSHDTDDNDYTGQAININIPLNADGAAFRLDYEDFILDNTTRNEYSEGYAIGAGATIPVKDSTRLGISGRQVEIDNGLDPNLSEFNWIAYLDFKLADGWRADVGYSDMVLYETPQLARTGIRLRNAYAGTWVRIDTNTWIQLKYAEGDLSDGNERQEINAKLQRTREIEGQGRFNYGLQYHSLRFALDLNNGYWDPEDYKHAELFADWTDTSKRTMLFDAAAFLGLNKDTGQPFRRTFRYKVGTRMVLYDGKLVLRGGYLSSDTATTVTSGPGYEYDSWYFGGNLEL